MMFIYIITMVILCFFADVTLAIIGSGAIFLNAVDFLYIYTSGSQNCNKKILDKRDKRK